MKTTALIAHRMPGRLRFRIVDKQGDRDYFETLSGQFSALESIRHIKANAAAGSITVEFSGDIDDVLQYVDEEELFDIDEDKARQWTQVPVQNDKPVNLVSQRNLDAMFMTGLAFAAMGLIQAIRGKVAVPAATAFWYAASVFWQSENAISESD